MSGDMIWPGGSSSSPRFDTSGMFSAALSHPHRGVRKYARQKEVDVAKMVIDYQAQRLQAFLDKHGTKALMRDTKELVNDARQLVGDDPALLALFAPMVDAWMQRQNSAAEFQAIKRMFW